MAWAAGDAAKGKTFFTVCVACHGPNGEGNQALHAPALAGQEPWYLKAQIKNFKEGIRGAVAGDTWGSTMGPMVATLTSEEAIDDVVAYIATLKAAHSPATLTGGNAEKGKTYFNVCVTCHGPAADGNETVHSPRLSIQQDWYMFDQLQKFKNGMRGANPKDPWGATMAPMAKTLPDEQAIKDVIAYIKTLK